MFGADSLRDAGIMGPSRKRPDCQFIGITRDTPTSAMIFHFVEKATKDKLDHREFLPNKLQDMSVEDYKKATNLSISRILHIARAFLTQAEFDTIKIEGDEIDPPQSKYPELWMALTKMVGKLLKETVIGKRDTTCELKLVVNSNKGKHYTGFPKVPPFISTANHPKEFKYDPNYDKFEIPLNTPDQEKLPNQGGNIANAGSGVPAPGSTGGAAGGPLGSVPSGSDDF